MRLTEKYLNEKSKKLMDVEDKVLAIVENYEKEILQLFSKINKSIKKEGLKDISGAELIDAITEFIAKNQ